MIGRIATLGVVGFWAGMMGWLVWHDVWPAWTAQDPPKTCFEDLPLLGTSHSQVGIFDSRGYRRGTAWTTSNRLGETALRDDCLWLTGYAALPPMRLEAESTFDAEGRLDAIEIHVYGHEASIELKGERFPREFAFELRVGYLPPRTFKIPHTQLGTFGDMFRPFAALHHLEVGQAWRMQVFNPAAAISGFGETFAPLLVRVTGTETLLRDGVPVKCFVVEAAGSQARVGADGVVYEQSVELPIGGTVIIRDEPYDAAALGWAKSIDFTKGAEVDHAR
jgi:hypothetical protein